MEFVAQAFRPEQSEGQPAKSIFARSASEN
jgi:hypothetical protein